MTNMPLEKSGYTFFDGDMENAADVEVYCLQCDYAKDLEEHAQETAQK